MGDRKLKYELARKEMSLDMELETLKRRWPGIQNWLKAILASEEISVQEWREDH